MVQARPRGHTDWTSPDRLDRGRASPKRLAFKLHSEARLWGPWSTRASMQANYARCQRGGATFSPRPPAHVGGAMHVRVDGAEVD
jgi:hypothetical protein